MEAIVLQYGLAGAVILAQVFAIKKLYADLAEAREDVDEARQDAIRALSDLLTKARSQGSDER